MINPYSPFSVPCVAPSSRHAPLGVCGGGGGVDWDLKLAGFDPLEIRETVEGVTVFFGSWCDLVRAWREFGGVDLSNELTGFVLFFPV